MTDYRPALLRIVRLADRGTFRLTDCVNSESRRYWEAECVSRHGRGEICIATGRDPGSAVRRLLAVLEKGRRDG